MDLYPLNKCPYCGSEVILKDAEYVYKTPKARSWGKVWVCSNFPACDAYVGCHPNTTKPLGRLANERLRALKSEAHRQFDPLWKSHFMSRRQAYSWLADKLNLLPKDCHIGMFDVKMCQRVIHLCRGIRSPELDKYRKNNRISRRKFTRGYK